MPFPFYKKLTVAQKRIYEQSDLVTFLRLPWVKAFLPVMVELASALDSGSQKQTQLWTQKLVNGFTQVFQVEPVTVRVLEKRPSNHRGELHGLYERSEKFPQPKITLWMRTAKRIQVVAFKTYLRTLIHEVLHHLDYTLLKLKDSYHTEGFYKRESSLMKQLHTSEFAQLLQKALEKDSQNIDNGN